MSNKDKSIMVPVTEAFRERFRKAVDDEQKMFALPGLDERGAMSPKIRELMMEFCVRIESQQNDEVSQMAAKALRGRVNHSSGKGARRG